MIISVRQTLIFLQRHLVQKCSIEEVLWRFYCPFRYPSFLNYVQRGFTKHALLHKKAIRESRRMRDSAL
jgi:hypothetical protein